MFIRRPAFDRAAVRSMCDSAAKHRDIYLERFKKGDHHVAVHVLNQAVSVVEYAVALEENDEVLRGHLDLAIDAGVVLYKTALNVGRTIAVSLAGQEHRYEVADRNYRATFQGFIAAFHVAVLGQRKSAINALSAFDLSRLNDASFNTSDEYAKRYALFLQGLYDKEAPHLQQLLQVSDAISEKAMHPLSFDYALRIVGPQLNLFTSLLTEDASAFDKELREALELHERYYVKAPEDALSPAALTSLALSALKRLAITQGLAVGASSDYLAEAMLQS